MFDLPGRHTHSSILDSGGGELAADDKTTFRIQGSRWSNRLLENQQIGSAASVPAWLDKAPNHKSRPSKDGTSIGKDGQSSDMELMKERFAKLLLGQDMSGEGNGVSSALALSNAITKLAASVFGKQWHLEPMSAERKARWRREIDWLLSVTDHIVEFVPSQQISKEGLLLPIMVTHQRSDLLVNIPALRKLDAMLIECLDKFKEQNEFWYASREASNSKKGGTRQRQGDKRWLPTVKVPPEGLSDFSRQWLQFQKESVNQVLKAAIAINTQVLAEMEIPEDYIESLPKNGRSSLGDSIYQSITVEHFDPNQFLSTLDLSKEHKVFELENRIEASYVIWKRKMINKDTKHSWCSAVSLEKRELFEERAENILLLLKHRFPCVPQSVLDKSKILYNKDVGQSVLECYSRVLKSLASSVMSRIEDVLYADSLTRNPSLAESKKKLPPSLEKPPVSHPVKLMNLGEEKEKLNATESPISMTQSNFMGWQFDQESQPKKDSDKLEEFQFRNDDQA